MKIKFYVAAILFCAIGAGTSQAAILDDIVDEIKSHTQHKKQRRHHHSYRHRHPISDEEKWQTALKFLGYYQGNINADLLTPESYKAIDDFQKNREVISTGFLEEESKVYLSNLYRVISLEKYLDYEGKNKRLNNKKIQAALAAEGLYSGKIDGKIGKKSRESIRLYKKGFDNNSTQNSKLNEEEKERLIKNAKENVESRLQTFKKDAVNSADSQTP